MLGIIVIWLLNLTIAVLPVVLLVWIACKLIRAKGKDYRFSQMDRETKAEIFVLRKSMDRYIKSRYPAIQFRKQDITNMTFRLYASGKPKKVVVEEYVRDLHDAEKMGLSYPMM